MDMHREAAAISRWLGDDEDSNYAQPCPECREDGIPCLCVYVDGKWARPPLGEDL